MKMVAVIGAGPAGMMAAGQAALQGARVVLLEKKDRVGRKLSITGNGRCNLTTSVDPELLIKGFPGNGRFLFSAFSEFSNRDLIEFFNKRGLRTKVEPGNRVFPFSDRALDVVQVLFDNARQAGVEFMLSTPVQEIIIKDARVAGVKFEQRILKAQALIIATGGLSYPGTGCTGDGYTWARAAGHRVVELRPALVPLLVREAWIKELQGLSLHKVRASACNEKGKVISEDCGELLFTHYGLSGPVILTMSHTIGNFLHKTGKPVYLKLDLEPDCDEKKLDERLQRSINENSRKMLKNTLSDFLPHKLIPVILGLIGIEAEKECHQISRSERREIVMLLKHFILTVVGLRPIDEAIITAGGVDVKEINPKTMESKLVKGLFFAGEVLDVDGYSGGYNLQAAFSTGYLAGKNAASLADGV